MSVISAILQGIVQGLTEFLPVSSSGHLVLFQHFTGTSGEESLFFNLMLHLGTLAAVVAVYYADIGGMLLEAGRMVKEIFTGKFQPKPPNDQRRLLYMLVLATLPMVLIVPLRHFVADITGDKDIVVEGVCFLITSLLLFLACRAKKGTATIHSMKARHAITIGLFQDLATMPGISRSGATMSGAMMMGFSRETAARFSFLLSIPAIVGGSMFEVGDAIAQGVTVDFLPLVAGMLAAALVGYLAIRLVRYLLMTDKFIIFAWYTLVLGVVVVIVGTVEHIVK